MTPNEQKAAREKVFSALNGGCGMFTAHYVFEQLSVAGLIVTDLHERALAAAEVQAGTYPTFQLEQSALNDGVLSALIRVGRESLAAKKPKERWAVRRTAVGNHWEVWERKETLEGAQYEVRAAVFECDSDGSEARAYVARKNAEAAK